MKAFDNPQHFFNEIIKSKIQQNPLCLSHSEIFQKKISLQITGPQGGIWCFLFDDKSAVQLLALESIVSDEVKNSTCHVEMNAETFEGVVRGTVNIPMAFMFRKIKVKGETSLAIRLGQALQKNSLV
jgi:putative sterol carrier protein